MEPVANQNRRPNWLFIGFLGVSVLMHGVLLYRSSPPAPAEKLPPIEFTLRAPPLPSRVLPTPPSRSRLEEALKASVEPAPIQKSPDVIPKRPPPHASPLPDAINDIRPLPSEMATIPRLRVTQWKPERVTVESENPKQESPSSVVVNPEDRDRYLNTVRQLIERKKKYPRIALLRKFQGTVLMEFVLLPTGELKSVRVLEGSRFEALEKAAVQAVENAAPYPKPPSGLFTGEIQLQIPVVFELI